MTAATTMGRKQFTFYESFAAAISRIRSASARCAAYDAIVNYAIHGVEPDVDSLPDAAAIAFDLIRPTLDAAAKRAAGGRAGTGPAKSHAKDNDKSTARHAKDSNKTTTRYAQDNDNEKEKEDEVEVEAEAEGEIENENECSLSTPSRPSFDAFWSAYPRKVGKEAARQAFRQVRVPTETLLTAIEAQKRTAQWTRDGGRYIPHPATWLREGRWEDEPAGQRKSDPPDLDSVRRLLARMKGEAPPGADGGGKEGG